MTSHPGAAAAFPSTRRRLWRLVALFTFASSFALAALLCFSRRPRIETLDLPVEIVSAQRILHGELPYRDFEVLYGALGHYAAAAFLWPLRSLQPVLAFDCYVLASVALFYGCLCCLLARYWSQPALPLLAATLVLLASCLPLEPIAYYSLPMLLPLLAAVMALQHSLRLSGGRAAVWQCIAGTCMAVEIFTRINFGIYLLAAVAATGVLAWLTGRRNVAVAVLRAMLGALVTGIFILAVLAAAGILRPEVVDLIAYLPRASAGRAIPWQSKLTSPPLLAALLVVLTTLLNLVYRLLCRQVDFWFAAYLLLLAFFSYALFRFDTLHLFPLIALSLLLLFDFPDALSRPSRACYWLQCSAVFLLLAVMPGSAVIKVAALLHMLPAAPVTAAEAAAASEPVTSRNGFSVTVKEAAMLDRLDSMRAPGEEVFWASEPGACQSSFDLCADMALYLSDRTLPRQKIWFFDTPSTPYADVQRRLIAGIDRARTSWIGMQGVYTPDTRLVAWPEAHLFNDYVLSHYQPVFSVDIPSLNRHYRVFHRRPGA